MIFQIYNNFHIRNLFVVLLYLYFSSALYYYITLLAYYLTHLLIFILWYFPCLKAFCIPSTLGTFIISVFRNYCLSENQQWQYFECWSLLWLVSKRPRTSLSDFLTPRLRFPNAKQLAFRLPITLANLDIRIAGISKFKVIMNNLSISRNRKSGLVRAQGSCSVHKYDAKWSLGNHQVRTHC